MSEQELELPTGWIKIPLEHLRVNKPKSIQPNKIKNKMFELYSIPAFPSKKPEILKGNEINSNKSIVEEETVLLSKINPHINRVWITGKFSSHTKICSTEWIPFFKQNSISQKYLQNFLQNQAFRNYLSLNVSGVGGSLTRINPNVLKNYFIPIPPYSEQKRIVSKIEELFSKIDSTKQLLEQTKLQLELYRQSLLQSAFEGKLVNNDSEDAKKIIDYLKIIENERKDEIFKHVLKNKKSEQYKFQEPRSYLEEEIPSISKKWHIASIETVCSLVSGGSTPLRTEEKNFSKTGFPLLKVENIPLNRGKIFLKNDQLRITKEPHNKKWQSKTYPNDVLINIVGSPLGKVGIVPENFPESNINQAIVLMRTVPSFLNKFLLYCLQSPQYYHFQIRLSTGVRQENIRKSLVGKFPIPIPSLEEQEQIVSQIEQGFSLIENTQRIVNSTLQTLQTMKMSVLKQAFEGKLVPQDPNDEPAEKLLERIKKEKS